MQRMEVSMLCVRIRTFLCMLVHHFQIGVRTSGLIVFRKEPETQSENRRRYSVEDICESLHPAQTEALLFLHCWSGRDTTSGFYGYGKLELFKKVNRSAKLQKIARQMGESNSSDDIGQLRVQLASFQYGDGDFGTDLSGLQYSKFCDIVAECSKFDNRVLPPTPRTIHFHSLRCHLQLVRWTIRFSMKLSGGG